MADPNEPDILHEEDVRGVIEDEIEKGVGADQADIADLVAITGGESPTEAEHNAVVTKVNAILDALRTAGILVPEE